MDVIVFTRADGNLTVRNLPLGATDQDFARAIQHAIDSGKAADMPIRGNETIRPVDHTFRNAWMITDGSISTDMSKAREIHADHIVNAQTIQMARLKVEERKERLRGNIAQADQHAADTTALEALDLNVLATRIANAATPQALKAIWPAKVP